MEFSLLAFDSFGVKSSCVQVEAQGMKILIDPGVAFEAGSFPWSLTKRLAAEARYSAVLRRAIKQSDVIVISHYHYDHHIPEPGLYKGKTLLVKDPENKINHSQKSRARFLLDDLNADVRIADGNEFDFNGVKLRFSQPAWHGTPGTKLGWVLITTIKAEGKTLVHSSDLDGPVSEEQADYLIKQKPDVLFLDGFPTYLLGYLVSYYNLARAVLNTERIVKNVRNVFLDHHLLRDYRYRDLYKLVYELAERKGFLVRTAAEEKGKKPAVISAYEKNGPTKWKTWSALTREDLKGYIERADGLIKTGFG